jgi:hypothetical protein
MRIFGSVVQSFVLSVLNAWQDFAFGGPIAPELVSNDHARHVVQPLEELAKKSPGGLFVAVALYQDIEHVPILIYRSPQGMLLAPDGEEDFVHMPRIPTARATTAQFIGVGLPKLQTPLPDCFIAHDDPALRQKLFDITKTERETEIQPHSIADDFRWETKTFVIGSNGVCFQKAILA